MTATRSRRIRAFLLHLSSSLLLAGGFAAATYFLWYPSPLLAIQGGLSIIALLLAVDTILGPLLTLLVFKPEKARRELATDISVILALQLGAFAYGAHAVLSERPAFLAFAYSQFYVVRSGDVSGKAAAEVGDAPRFGALGPRVVFASIPDTALKNGTALLAAAMGDPSFALDASRYRSKPDDRARLTRESLLAADVPLAVRSRVAELAVASGTAADDVALYQVLGRIAPALAVLRLSDAKLLGILAIDRRGSAATLTAKSASARR
ncbi:MAG: hypothetical protein KDH15_06400 [Rhodocyclaceae bacterium]|nr:hypothetical protein [Rhodocyclaceae bacterium]